MSGEGKIWSGSSLQKNVLVEVKHCPKCHHYLFFGDRVYEFTTSHPIVDFQFDRKEPYARDSANCYYLLNKVAVMDGLFDPEGKPLEHPFNEYFQRIIMCQDNVGRDKFQPRLVFENIERCYLGVADIQLTWTWNPGDHYDNYLDLPGYATTIKKFGQAKKAPLSKGGYIELMERFGESVGLRVPDNLKLLESND